MLNMLSMYVYFLACLVNFVLFVDGQKRMQKVFAQIPVLKKSERVFSILMLIYTTILITGFIGIISY